MSLLSFQLIHLNISFLLPRLPSTNLYTHRFPSYSISFLIIDFNYFSVSITLLIIFPDPLLNLSSPSLLHSPSLVLYSFFVLYTHLCFLPRPLSTYLYFPPLYVLLPPLIFSVLTTPLSQLLHSLFFFPPLHSLHLLSSRFFSPSRLSPVPLTRNFFFPYLRREHTWEYLSYTSLHTYI